MSEKGEVSLNQLTRTVATNGEPDNVKILIRLRGHVVCLPANKSKAMHLQIYQSTLQAVNSQL